MDFSNNFAMFPLDPTFTIIAYYLIPALLSIIGFYVSYKLYTNISSKPREMFIVAFSLTEDKTFTEMKIIAILFGMLFTSLSFTVIGMLTNNSSILSITMIMNMFFGIGMIYIITRWNKRISKVGKEWKQI
ncbi:MAG: hypothetical protein QXL97_00880 [Candidatus Aenigmatarchaeota archaeon]